MGQLGDLKALEQKLRHYQPSPEAITLIGQTAILLLVGISGAGKDTIKQELLKTGNYHHIISNTTRVPRENHGVRERDGIDYHFIDLAEAERMVDAKQFVEAKMYSGNVYGTSVKEIQVAHDAGKIAITDMEVQGVAEYKAISPEVTAAFIVPPNFAVWQQRFEQRYGGTGIDESDRRRRMQTAVHELDTALNSNQFFFVINDELDRAVQEVDTVAHYQVSYPIEREAREIALKLSQGITANIWHS